MQKGFLQLLAVFTMGLSVATAQIGINTTTPNGALEVNSSTSGMVIPKVALTSTSASSPVTNPQGGSLVDGTLVYNTVTTGSGSTAVSPGFYYWSTSSSAWIAIAGDGGKNWTTTGNTGTSATSNFIGTKDANALVFKTNATERMRLFSGGQIGINNTSPSSTDLFTATANSTYTSAINGYTDYAGCGVFGKVSSGTSAFGGVQGAYNGTSSLGSGVVGFTSTTTGGSDFLGGNVSALYGELSTGNLTRCFGTMGATGDNSNVRTGGVIGTDYYKSGALGYYANNGSDYAVYGFGTAYQTGGTTGRTSQALNTGMGMGIYGGVIGGWIKGDEYGTVFTGPRFSTYHLGKVISNDNYLLLTGDGDKKTVSYASTSLQPEISQKGKAQLVSGRANIVFPKAFTEQLDPDQEVIVTCTPMGESKGVYIAKSDSQGFTVVENAQGQSNVPLQWIAIGTRKATTPLSDEVTEAGFEQHLNQVMHDENVDGGEAIWTENGEVKFGEKAPINPVKLENMKKYAKKKQLPTPTPSGN